MQLSEICETAVSLGRNDGLTRIMVGLYLRQLNGERPFYTEETLGNLDIAPQHLKVLMPSLVQKKQIRLVDLKQTRPDEYWSHLPHFTFLVEENSELSAALDRLNVTLDQIVSLRCVIGQSRPVSSCQAALIMLRASRTGSVTSADIRETGCTSVRSLLSRGLLEERLPVSRPRVYLLTERGAELLSQAERILR